MCVCVWGPLLSFLLKGSHQSVEPLAVPMHRWCCGNHQRQVHISSLCCTTAHNSMVSRVEAFTRTGCSATLLAYSYIGFCGLHIWNEIHFDCNSDFKSKTRFNRCSTDLHAYKPYFIWFQISRSYIDYAHGCFVPIYFDMSIKQKDRPMLHLSCYWATSEWMWESGYHWLMELPW